MIMGFAVMTSGILRFAGITGAGKWNWNDFSSTIITIYIMYKFLT